MNRAMPATEAKETVELCGLTCRLRRSKRRSTVGITVEPSGEVVLAIPAGSSLGDVEQVVRRRLSWIYARRAEQHQRGVHSPEREYVAGAGFYFLGTHYRLKWSDDEREEPVARRGRRLYVQRNRKEEAERLVQDWYKAEARPWIGERTRRYAERIGAAPSGVTIQDLGKRWGSCGKNRRVYFHWRTIQLPPRIVEYVVAHELVHLVEPNHSPAFWKRLRRCMPDYARRKRWLDSNGSHFSW